MPRPILQSSQRVQNVGIMRGRTENNRHDTTTNRDEVDLLDSPSWRSVTVLDGLQEEVEVIISQCSDDHSDVHDRNDIDQPVSKRASINSQRLLFCESSKPTYLAAAQVMGFICNRFSLSSRCKAYSA